VIRFVETGTRSPSDTRRLSEPGERRDAQQVEEAGVGVLLTRTPHVDCEIAERKIAANAAVE